MSTLTYRAILTPDDGGWMVNVPDISGCVSFGETVEAAKQNAKETIEAFLGNYLDREEPFPVPSREIVGDETSEMFEITVEAPSG
ncbi:MAG TPA: type II toxin-antitoxin system HicB family antitoxin [Fimbriimonadaceae bacterium]|jgi:predicted RNase H-like HicB family nuclease